MGKLWSSGSTKEIGAITKIELEHESIENRYGVKVAIIKTVAGDYKFPHGISGKVTFNITYDSRNMIQLKGLHAVGRSVEDDDTQPGPRNPALHWRSIDIREMNAHRRNK